MTFSWDFNIGHVIMVVVPLLGGLVGYITLRVKAADNEEKTKALNTRVDAYGTALADLRLHVESTCVKKDDLERLDERMSRRFDTVEHTIRNMTTTILANLTGRGDSRGTRQ